MTLGTEFVSRFVGHANYTYHATLCYTSLDFADRWIDAYADENRTEPTFTCSASNGPDGSNGNDNITADAAQLDTGYASSLPPPSAEERGILQIRGPVNWSAPQSDQPSNDGPSVVPIVSLWPPPLPWLTSHLHIYQLSYDNTDDAWQLGNYNCRIRLTAI